MSIPTSIKVPLLGLLNNFDYNVEFDGETRYLVAKTFE